MNALFEFLPLLLFLAAYFYKGIYFALAVLMVAMPIGLGIKYFKTRKLDRLYLWSTIFLLLFGAATFYFNNPTFYYWKPTAFYWVVAAAFLVSSFVGEKPLVRRFLDLSKDLPTEQLSMRQWHGLNSVWAAFFLLMGAANIYVAYNYPEPVWVKFKVFGLMGLTIAFMLIQTFWLFSRLNLPEESRDTEHD